MGHVKKVDFEPKKYTCYTDPRQNTEDVKRKCTIRKEIEEHVSYININKVNGTND